MDKKAQLNKDALAYHREPRPGKISISVTKSCTTQRDLSLAYTPGVAAPCLEIEREPSLSYEYTARGNLVGVITNGTAVLGLGAIGALAGKPVMEGKAVLFKKFAGIDAFDIEIDERDPKKFCEIVKSMEPTFGGINLEDIKAPECFEIESRLKSEMGIPVFHDDQHGTAIIAAAGLMNACELTGRRLDGIKVVFSGAGAAAVACARMFEAIGVSCDNIWMIDKDGLVTDDRIHEDLNKGRYAKGVKQMTLAQALRGADLLMGLSVGGIVDGEMIKVMENKPIIFAMANPTPEIMPEAVFAARSDAIVATGRSDYANQINNVLGFPSIFRGALDVRATTINEEMKLAATKAIAGLAKEEVPSEVLNAYSIERLKFGSDYIIPKPLDPRVLMRVAPAIAAAAKSSGVARRDVGTTQEYRMWLDELMRV